MKRLRRYGLRQCETSALLAGLQTVLVDRGAAARAVHSETLDLLAWGRRYLPHYFTAPPSTMHRALAERLDAADRNRGSKLNVIGIAVRN